MIKRQETSPVVVIAGELNVDVIVSGRDVMPEWNREKMVDGFEVVLGSSSAITACALASLGADVRFVSVVGDDDFGKFCIAELQRMGVNTEHVTRLSRIKTGVTLSLSTPVDRGLLTYAGSIPLLTPDYIPESLLQQATHLHFGSYYLQDGMRPHWAGLFAKLRANGISTSFDTGWDVSNQWDREGISALLTETDLFIPSEDELLHIFPADRVADVLDSMLPAVAGIVAVKQGSKGATLRDLDKSTISAGSYTLSPIDTTGAGDCFNAGIIYGYLLGMRGGELLRFANACGALSTLGIGGTGSLPTMEAVLHLQEGLKS
ncbi:MAG TPA: carbohydrate kinase family protein [Paenibacillus sp.]|uniref:carbohydrate kinase family protein n=1 Tax=Paenibacillus TaxID=44249 RepID=UPI000BA0A1E7|nr:MULTISPECIES: carbohydrate kinase family protein [Paenibacillus]OZQ73417.1 kinase [Paenibacillus taichungensis]HBU82236.1 carbohydrate kinase family protein [Paenibacillus sp.]